MKSINCPNCWLFTPLGNVVQYGKTQKSSLADVSPSTWVLELEDIEKNSSRLLRRLHADTRPFKSSKNKFKSGDVLYGKLRPYLNKVLVADDEGVCSTEIVPLNAEPFVLSKYLFYWVKSSHFLNYVNDVSYGVNMPRLGTKDGLAAPFLLPPLAEQKVIAEKLDTLLAQVEVTKARLESTLETLKQFRQSVLAAAVSGELTDIDDFKAESFDKLIKEMRNGLSPKPNDDGLGYPILRISSVRSLEVDTSDIRYLECDELTRDRYALKADDLLFTRYNGSLDFVGVCGLFKGCKYETLLYPDKLIRVRTNKSKLLPQYAEIYFSSPDVRSLVTNFVKSTSGQKGISGKDLKSVVVRYPTIVEQKRVIGMVEKLFTGADATEQQVNQALERVNNLSQSILAKAFRGELTEQWRKENPDLISGENSAEALLKKIKAERAAAKPKRKARTTSA
ncbi:TPA: restriction endonuclease subunit S [Vibrio cholerae]